MKKLAENRNNEKRFTGLAISSGLILGRVCLLSQSRHNPLPSYQVSDKGQSRELARLKLAIAAVVKHLKVLQEKVAERIGQAEAEIFIAQGMIVQDPALFLEMEQTLQNGFNAETAVLLTMQDYEAKLSAVDDVYMGERAGDIGELKHRLLDELCDTRPSFICAEDTNCRRGKDRIVIAEELTASMTLEINTDRVLGFVTERGGKTSHAAILARALGIPAVSGIENIHTLVPCGTEVLLNGETGEVVVAPSQQTRSDAVAVETFRRLPPADPVPQLRVMANISLASETSELKEMMAEGIGL